MAYLGEAHPRMSVGVWPPCFVAHRHRGVGVTARLGPLPRGGSLGAAIWSAPDLAARARRLLDRLARTNGSPTTRVGGHPVSPNS
jgi:hypothetical protein